MERRTWLACFDALSRHFNRASCLLNALGCIGDGDGGAAFLRSGDGRLVMKYPASEAAQLDFKRILWWCRISCLHNRCRPAPLVADTLGRFRGSIREPVDAQLSKKPSRDVVEPIGPFGPISGA